MNLLSFIYIFYIWTAFFLGFDRNALTLQKCKEKLRSPYGLAHRLLFFLNNEKMIQKWYRNDTEMIQKSVCNHICLHRSGYKVILRLLSTYSIKRKLKNFYTEVKKRCGTPTQVSTPPHRWEACPPALRARPCFFFIFDSRINYTENINLFMDN